MSKEDKIHEWIESQNSERKQRHLEKLQKELGIQTEIPQPKLRKRFFTRKLVAICSSAAVAIVITLSLVLYFTVFHPNPTPTDKSRYCTQEDYTVSKTTMTLKEYGEQEEKNLLYFDWYDSADEIIDSLYALKDTNEEIAFKEFIVNGLTGNIIYLSVTDNYTEIEEFQEYKNNCTFEYKIQNTTIFWFYRNNDGQMYWEYEGYKYYLTIMGPSTSDEAFALVAELFE
ncbi:MAG: hypothetical protein IJ506_05830 [Clostridia bacterium]|nr:hypothetical protein [Clostridia bacterium]